MTTKKICVLLCFQSFLCAKHFALITKVIFIQGAFKNIQGLFTDIPQFFNFQRLFIQGHDAFSGTFQGLCEPWFKTSRRQRHLQ